MSSTVATENLPVEQPPTAVEVPAAEAAMPAEEKKPKQRKPREKKPESAKAPSHPPYFQMIKEAVTALNDKSGSSPQAIAKFIQEKHKNELPMNFRKMLTVQLRNSAAKGKLIKIKASYKLAEPAAKKKSKRLENKAGKKPAAQKTETTAKRGRKPGAVKKPKKPAASQAKPKQPKSIKSPAAKKAKKAAA